MQATTDESKRALLERWKSAEAVPIDQAVYCKESCLFVRDAVFFQAIP